MAQAEDTELRDLVIEALEKNGSLAKIRALLRANIFLAFEDECQNIKQNVSLDNILNLPEGVLSLCVIHEFLEYCNLKNTLFVYMSESRQGKEYRYDGRNVTADKLNLSKIDKEPILVTLIRKVIKQFHKNVSQDEDCKGKKENHSVHKYKDDQNSTYIVHEDSTTTSQSQSDNSSDEKNKLHLRLPLDNSDTDTSSDSARDKTSSEYIANEHILEAQEKHNFINDNHSFKDGTKKNHNIETDSGKNLHEHKIATNSSSDSTSYLELKPFNPLDKLMLNTTGLPVIGEGIENIATQSNVKSANNIEISSPVSISSASTGSLKNDISGDRNTNISVKNSLQSPKMEAESADYSYDFMASYASSKKNISQNRGQFLEYTEQDPGKKSSHNSSVESQNQNSQSSQSSISISDVADLLNENLSLKRQNKSYSRSDHSNSKSRSVGKHKFNDVSYNAKHASDDSGDFSESPIPSLSNLSLDIHSD